jgi:eukaryotic-like serine/threonine-protein kinase
MKDRVVFAISAQVSDPDLARQTEAWVDALWGLPENQRADRLAELEQNSPQAAAAVHEWIDAIAQSDGYLESARSDSRTHLNPGDNIGVWRLLKFIGHGGMGEVWLAERADGTFDKRVAIKFIRNDTAQLRQSLEAERRLLAQLTHPRIAHLLDGGVTGDGLPYLVTEYVEGLPIHHWCTTCQPDIAKRLNLFRQVCDAVAYAHSNLIVHSDIKPNNILVDRNGRIHLLDFGIARVVQENGDTAIPLTSAGITPDYAAPEQLTGGRVTMRTDIYSLGVLLYLLISGRRPLEMHNAPLAVLTKHICCDMPLPPTRQGKLPTTILGVSRNDLDTIALKALAKAPQDRYASVETLLADIDNAMAHRPIAARQSSRSYIVRRFLRRHRLWIGAAACIVAALAIGLGTALHQTRVAEHARDIAHKRENEASATRNFLVALLGDAAPNNEKLTLNEILAQAHKRVLDSSLLPEQRTAMMQTLLDIYDQRDDVREESSLLQELLAEPDHLSPELYVLAACLMGDVKSFDRKFDEAKSWTERGLARSHDLPDSPENARWRCELNLGYLAEKVSNNLDKAQNIYAQGLGEIERSMSQAAPQDGLLDYGYRYAFMEMRYGSAMFNAGRFKASTDRFRHALGILEQLHRKDENLGIYIRRLIARNEAWLGHPLRADQEQSAVVARQQQIGGNSLTMAGQLLSAAQFKLDLAQADAALPLIDSADAIYLAAIGNNNELHAQTVTVRGVAYALLGESERSRLEFGRAKEILDPLGSSSYGIALTVLSAEALQFDPKASAEQIRTALSTFIDMQALLVRPGTVHSFLLPSVIVDTAEAALRAGDLKLATDQAAKAHKIYLDKGVDPDSAWLARCDVVRGEVLLREGNRVAAAALFKTAAAHMETSLGPQHPRTLKARELAAASNE